MHLLFRKLLAFKIYLTTFPPHMQDAVGAPVEVTSTEEISSLGLLKGSPSPLGVSLSPGENSVNFALFSEHAKGVTLCL